MKSCFLLLFTLICSTTTALAQNLGTLSGRVSDKNSKEPVIGAVVYITGSTKGTTTDIDGKYTLKLEPGVYKLAVSYVSYKPTNLENVTIEAGKTTTLNIGIEEDSKQLNAVTIVGTRQTNTEISLIKELRQSDVVVSGISGEQISKSLDRDAAETVKRIPGVTIMNNRYIYIRGLSERYNTVMLNDALTPSTEVDVKAFSFDVLPSSVIDRIMIYKGGSPELPGEYGGGVIKIYTKNFADDNTTTLSLTGGYRGGTTFKNFNSYQGSSTDFLGFDNGYRALPNSFPVNLGRTDAETLTKLGRALPNSWAPVQSSASPDLRLSLGLTRRINIGSAQISNISALTYSNTRQTIAIERDRYLQFDGTSSQKEFSYADVQSNQNVRLGLVHNWAVRLNENHKIEFRNLFNQLGSSEVVLREGTDFTKNIDIQSTALRYESRGIYSGQLQGTHDLNQQRSQFTWTTGYSRTSRNEPDFRRLRNQRESGTEEPFLLVVPFNPDPQQVGRFYSKLNENIYMAGSQFEHGLGKQDSVTGETKIKVRAGFYAEHKARDFNARWMSYIKGNASQFDESIRTLPVDQIFQPENINPVTGFKLAEGTNPSDRYQASNDLLAAYAGASAPITENFSIAGGVRVEHNRQQLTSAKYGGELVEVNNPVTSVLPSLNLTYNLSPRTLLRSSNSISVNRPEFRELAPFSYYDFQLNSEIKGNPELQTATIYATDLRYEFYPNPTEAISFGVFYKQFRNPIESVILPTSENPIFSFANAEFAQSYGLETEVRKSLLDVSENRIIQNMSLVLNASVIKSKVDMGEEVSETQDRNRAMMGQSPYIVNTGIYYQDDERNLQVNLLYNIIGKRIFLVGNFLNPTVYEMPRHAIDLSVSKRIGQRLEIKAGIQDLLNQKIRLTQDSNQDGKITGIDENIANYRRGAYSSMGISYKF